MSSRTATDEDRKVLDAGLRTAVVAVTELARRALDLTAPDRTRLIAEVDAAIAGLTTARSDLLLAQRASGTWKGSGDPSFEAWRSRTSRSGLRAATTEVRRAETLVAMPGMRQATTAGQVSVEHVDVVAKVAAGASAPVRDALASPEGQAELLGLARRMDAGTFARSATRWAAARDALAHERGHEAQRASRYLHLVDTDTGTRLTGLLDRMAGHRLRLALEAANPRPAADDERSHEQRQADALDAIAERILALPDTTSGAAVRPHVSFVMDAQTWAAMRTARDKGGSSAVAEGGEPAGAAGREPVTLEDGTPVPPSEVARALCDCELTRIVLDADSAPLNLGRTQRTYTGVQRRGVIVRDRGCAWPTCGTPARWCEVHHIKWWDRDGGETSVEQGALLCSFHHHEVHRLSLAITRFKPTDPLAATAGNGLAGVAYRFTAPDGRVVAPATVRPPGATGRPPGAPEGPPGVPERPTGVPERPTGVPERPTGESGFGDAINGTRGGDPPQAPARARPPETRPPNRTDEHGPTGERGRRDGPTPSTAAAPLRIGQGTLVF